MRISWKSLNPFWRLFRKQRDELVVELEPVTQEVKAIIEKAVAELIAKILVEVSK